jgi:hypothetical protein
MPEINYMTERPKKKESPEEFWRGYAARYGETVLSYILGKYLSGWDEFDAAGAPELWGLLIATSGGFRFHHFPHEGWLEAVVRATTGGEAPQEKTLFIPAGSMRAAEIRSEKSWWKRILFPRQPRLVLRYRNEDGREKELIAETGSNGETLAGALCSLIRGPQR